MEPFAKGTRGPLLARRPAVNQSTTDPWMPMAFELSLEAEPGRTATAILDANSPVVIVGRKRDLGLTTTNRTVSREHAEFRWQDGQVQVRDLDSTAGTFINGKRVQRGVVGLGDSVTCGKLEVRVRDLGGRNAPRNDEDLGGGGGGGGTAILDAYEPMDLDEPSPTPARGRRDRFDAANAREDFDATMPPERDLDLRDAEATSFEAVAAEPDLDAEPEESEPETAPAEAALLFTFLDIDGNTGSFELSASNPEFIVGRGKQASVRVKHKTVSRKHCAIRWCDGKAEISDLGSSAGTYVAGQKITRRVVGPGELIVAGKLEIEVSDRGGQSGGHRPSPSGPWSFVFKDIEGNEHRHQLGEGDAPITIGRGKAATIRIQETTAGREHCRLTYRDGALVVTDLKSRNGTYVNDERVNERSLSAGDTLRCGSFPITIEGPKREGAIEDWEENWDDDWTDLDAMKPPSWHLVYTSDTGLVEIESLDPTLRILALGSDSDCEICIENAGVEPDHCEFTWEEGVLVATDLETEAGTLVRGKAITERVLKNGDMLCAGDFRVHAVRGAGRSGPSKSARSDSAQAWAEHFEAKDSSLCLVYCYGDEQDPSFSDIGKVELTIWGDGEARVEVTNEEGRFQGMGKLHEDLVRKILKALDYAAYPEVPQVSGAEESCPVEISAYINDDEVTAMVSHKHMNRVEYYREAIELMRATAYELECSEAS